MNPSDLSKVLEGFRWDTLFGFAKDKNGNNVAIKVEKDEKGALKLVELTKGGNEFYQAVLEKEVDEYHYSFRFGKKKL